MEEFPVKIVLNNNPPPKKNINNFHQKIVLFLSI